MTRDLEPLWSGTDRWGSPAALETDGDALTVRGISDVAYEDTVEFTREQVRSFGPALVAWAMDHVPGVAERVALQAGPRPGDCQETHTGAWEDHCVLVAHLGQLHRDAHGRRWTD